VTPAPEADSKAAIEVTPDSGAELPHAGTSPSASACEPWREWIETKTAAGRNAKAIWQELVDDHGFSGHYQSVKRFVRKLLGGPARQACAIIETPPGEEAQVDYGDGPMVRDPNTGKYRRTRLFVLTLGYSRKSIRLLTFQSSARIWAELHEQAFRRLGGVTRIVVLDNLRKGVLKPDIYRSGAQSAVPRHARTLWLRRHALPSRAPGSEGESRVRSWTRPEDTVERIAV
jgi:transposase